MLRAPRAESQSAARPACTDGPWRRRCRGSRCTDARYVAERRAASGCPLPVLSLSLTPLPSCVALGGAARWSFSRAPAMCASGGGLFARIGAAFSSLSARLDEVQGDAAALNGKEFGEACKALVPLFGELGVALKVRAGGASSTGRHREPTTTAATRSWLCPGRLRVPLPLAERRAYFWKSRDVPRWHGRACHRNSPERVPQRQRWQLERACVRGAELSSRAAPNGARRRSLRSCTPSGCSVVQSPARRRCQPYSIRCMT